MISIEDMARDGSYPPAFIRLFLRRSKTDPLGQGIAIYLGRTGASICPVQALLAYMAVRPLGLSGPLFCFPDGSPLCRDHLIKEVRSILAAKGLNPAHYSGHSFRIGAATSAAAAGIPDHAIKMLGRWSSSAYTLYLRTPPVQLAAYSAQLASPSVPTTPPQ